MPTLNGSLLFQFCTAIALLPLVVVVDWPVAGSTSHAGCPGTPTTSAQPRAGTAHHRLRVSAEDLSTRGELGKTSHEGWSASWSIRSSRTSTAPSRAST